MRSGGHSGEESEKRTTRLLVATFCFVVAAALWIVFVDSSNVQEMLVGLFSVTATVIFTFFVSHTTGTNLRLRARDVAQCWRIPWYIVSGVAQLVCVFVKDLLHIEPAPNLFRVCGFDASKHDPVRIGRMTLAVALTTATPNFIVLGVDPAQSRMLFHQLSRTGIPRMTRSLGAKG